MQVCRCVHLFSITGSCLHYTPARAISYNAVHAHLAKLLSLQEELAKLTSQRMEAEVHVTELEDLLNSNLLKRQQELTKRLQQADVDADRFVRPPLACTSCQVALHLLQHMCPCVMGLVMPGSVCISISILKLFSGIWAAETCLLLCESISMLTRPAELSLLC